MFFRQVLYRDLGCASYVLGDEGEAAVIDPRWDIQVYLDIARDEALRIGHVIDTHDHADHVSGRSRLASATGAREYRAASADDPQEQEAMVADREIALGALRLRALATPGHRRDHVAIEVIDLARGREPWFVLTGDSLLVGDLARPDLVLEVEEGSRALHASMQALMALPDEVEVWPGHVGGSLCGGAGLSGKTCSTIGFERRHNPLLAMGRDEFVATLTANLPPRPPNIERIVSLNREDAGEPADPPGLGTAALWGLLKQGATVLDSRAPEEFDRGHLAAALNLPLNGPGVGTRAGWSVSTDEHIVVAAENASAAREMTLALQAVGLWNITGFATGAGAAWERDGLPVARASSWSVEQLAQEIRRERVELVDVRDTAEWLAGHVPGSRHLPLDVLGSAQGIGLARRGLPTAVACAAGMRAAFAASLLRRSGHREVVRIADGGIPDLPRHGIELTPGA